MDSDVKDRMLAADQYNSEKEYWLKKLSGELVKTCFPPDTPLLSNEQPKQEVVPFQFPEPLYERLILISNNSDSRLHTILVTGVLLLLFKYTSNEDIIIGTPIDKQDIEGEFLNTILPLRIQIDEQSTVKHFLMAVKQTILEASENQNYPIETIPHELRIPMVEGDFPLFDIAILLQNIQDKQYLRHIQPSLLFSFLRTPETIEGIVEFNAASYRIETIQRIVAHFIDILQIAFFNVELKLVDVPLLTEVEKKQMVFDFNNTTADYPASQMIQHLFEEQVNKTPENMAVECHGEKLTYRALNEQANQLARILQAKGIGARETVIAIMLESSLEVPIAILAVLKAGGTYLPLGFEYPEARIEYMLQDSRAQLLLTRQSLLEAKNFQCPRIDLDDRTLFTGPIENLQPSNQNHPLAYIIYTSGTTGQPKGVMVEQQGLVNYIWWAAQTYVRGEHVHFPLFTSISFDLTVTSIFTPLITGNAILVYGGTDVRFYIEDVIADNRVQVVKMTPSHLQFIRDQNMSASNIKRIIVGGDKLDARLAQDIYRNFDGKVEIYNEYGPTETVVGSMIYKFQARDSHTDSVPIGVPIANTRIYLLNPFLQPVPIGVEGELYIAGDGLARGYLYNPEMTAKKFLPDPFFNLQKMYRTGDTAFRLPDGNIKYKGRIDHQVKIRGFRIELTEIEEKISLYDGVKEAALVVKEEEEDKSLYAFFTAERTIDLPAIRIYLTEVLPAYMVPGFMMQLQQMPLTPNGKIDRKALLNIEVLGHHDNYAPPENEVQSRMIDIWSEVLGLEKDKIGIHTNFFEVGGHSLKVMSLVAKIQKQFNVKLSLVQVFNTPTAAGLSTFIDPDQLTDPYMTINPAEAKEYYPLSSAQRRFYLAHELNPGNMAYNMPGILHLPLDFDEKKLEMIFKTLIQRHESLRTSFKIMNNEPAQFIHQHIDFKIEYFGGTQTAAFSDVIAKFIRPFNLSVPPLFRVAVIKTHQNVIVVMDIHHIISDGVSFQILTREFHSLSNDHLLSPLSIQYKDYASWQYYFARGDSYKNMENYWLKTLENFKITVLPKDIQNHQGAVSGRFETATIPQDTYLKIEEFCITHKLTYFSFMFSIFSLVILEETRENDITLGTPVDNREHSDLEHLIGVFLNVFLLRVIINENETLIKNILEINNHVIQALENNTYPYEELYYKLRARDKFSDDELFTILFNFLPDEEVAKAMPGNSESLGTAAIEIPPKYPLTIYISDTREKMILSLVYRADLYSKNRIQRIMHNYLTFIQLALTQEDTMVSALVYKDEEESVPLQEFAEEFDNEDLF